MKITEQTTLKEINELECFSQIKNHFIGGGAQWFVGEEGNRTLKQLNEQNPTWYVKDMVYGLENLQKIAKSGIEYVFPLEERDDSVCLIYLPAEHREKKPFVILNAGGGYGAVCTMVEALPVAARLNELGVDCFCLNYSVAKQETFGQGLMPKPLDDLASAWKFIHEHETEFGLSAYEYIVGGFSAGGHLAAMWGTKHLGARNYGIPQPKGLMLAYPLISLETIEESPIKRYMQIGLFGMENIEEKEKLYTVDRYVDENYPITYLIQCKDDTTVPWENADLMQKVLQKSGIPFQIEIFDIGQHGFGLGSKMPGDEWVERAKNFLIK